jgi:hypothetical protein
VTSLPIEASVVRSGGGGGLRETSAGKKRKNGGRRAEEELVAAPPITRHVTGEGAPRGWMNRLASVGEYK